MIRKLLYLIMCLGCFVFAFFAACAGEDPVKECSFNSDCKDITTRCERTTNKCVTIECTDDADCRSGTSCDLQAKRCIEKPARECNTDLDCNNQKKCDAQGRCVIKAECEKDSDCTEPTKPMCQNQACVSKICQKDDDCKDPDKFVCASGQCQLRKPECGQHNDCKDDQKPVCRDGHCVEDLCSKDGDCVFPKRPRCVSQRCVADEGKAAGEQCEQGKVNCRRDLICHREDPTKSTGICRKTCNPFQPVCDAQQVCQQLELSEGICIERNNGKDAGENCSKESCERQLACVKWKGQEICAQPCEPNSARCAINEECYPVKKPAHYCVSHRDPCGSGRPCEEGYLCLGGFCDPPPDCDTIKCPDDEICEHGRCRKKRCPDELTCPEGKLCNSITGECQADDQDPNCTPCETGGKCKSSTALCLSGLSPNTGESFCFESCVVGQSCADPSNFTCRNINITLSNIKCLTDSDCPDSQFKCDNYTSQCYRTIDLCLPIIGTCKNQCKGVTCTPPQRCAPITGKCFTPGKQLCDSCTLNDECGGIEDLCLRLQDGKNYCGQDCTTKSCPTGYRCYPLQNSSAKQCAPDKTPTICPP